MHARVNFDEVNKLAVVSMVLEIYVEMYILEITNMCQ
jgi:hypothetical protein